MIADHFSEWFPQLVGHAVRHGCHDAEGFASDAFLRSLEAERQGKTILKAYVFQALRNLMIDDMRRYQRHGPDNLTETVVNHVAAHHDWDAGMEAERLLTGMTPNQAEALRLCAAGYHDSEIAEAIATTTDAVKHLKLRGRAKARRAA